MFNLILHCTQRSTWNAGVARGAYTAASLASEGFIHFSKLEQFVGSANRFFRGQTDLVLLCVDADRLLAKVVNENLEGGTVLFPHVYGPVNLDAVTAVVDFPCEADGTFRLPAAVAEMV
jgi:uncharacterized protein (DUF952 family)